MSARDGLIDRIEYSDQFETSRVKVAVLDTGIDWNDSYIRGAKERIKGCKNWADDRQEDEGQQEVHDTSGHGTHVTALLLRTAPEALIYVSRVADQNGDMVSAEKIAEVCLLSILLACYDTKMGSSDHSPPGSAPVSLLSFLLYISKLTIRPLNMPSKPGMWTSLLCLSVSRNLLPLSTKPSSMHSLKM